MTISMLGFKCSTLLGNIVIYATWVPFTNNGLHCKEIRFKMCVKHAICIRHNILVQNMQGTDLHIIND